MDRRRERPARRRVYREQPHREAYNDEYYGLDVEEEEEEAPRRRQRPARQRPIQRPVPKKRSVWPVLLMGCGLGIVFTVLGAAVVVFLALRSAQGGTITGLPGLNGTREFKHEEKQTLALSALTQLQICDKFGDVTVVTDSQVKQPTVSLTKIVQADSQTTADQQFKGIAVQIQPPETVTTLACLKSQATPTAQTTSTQEAPSASSLIINVVYPENDAMVHTNHSSVNLNVALPPTLLQSDAPTLHLNIEAPVGNIKVDGLSGILNVRGGTGNVSVSRAAIADGSHIDTGQGDVTFNGFILLPQKQDGQTARYYIRSEQGKLDVTLPSNTNVTLDANTNVGGITSQFPITVKTTSDNSASYHGLLNPAGPPTTQAVLVVDVSSGDIAIHQLQT